MRKTLGRSERLRGKKTIDMLFADGKSGFVFPFRYVYKISEIPIFDTGAQMTEEELPRKENLAPIHGTDPITGILFPAVLFSVPKKYHKRANRRNLLKRRTREAYRNNKSILCQNPACSNKSISLALIYCTDQVLEYNKIEDAIRRILEQIPDTI